MPEQRETAYYESGRATAPPGVCYSSLAGSTSEGYSQSIASTPSSDNLADQHQLVLSESPVYISNCTNFAQQTPQASPCYTSGYSPCQSPSLEYPLTIPKNNSLSLQFQSSDYIPSYHTYTSNFPSSSFSTFNSSNIVANSNSDNSRSSSSSSNNNNNQNTKFELLTTSKHSPKNLNSFLSEESFLPSEQSSILLGYAKISKANTAQSQKYASNHANFYFSSGQPKYVQSKEGTDGCSEKKCKKDFEVIQRAAKVPKDDEESNRSSGELQQLFSKPGTKVKSSQEPEPLVTDSLLHFLQKKTPQDNFSYDSGDISQILFSLTSKYKFDDGSGSKKKDASEDSKLVNDFLTKIILEKEEKRFKSSSLTSSSDEKKKLGRREIFDEPTNEFDEKKSKRDAMSHYQEDKAHHHKRPPNYGDFNQWDYLTQQDVQTPNNHNRRGHFPFSGGSQSHSMGWNPAGMAVSRQANPYYPNPHGHVVPAHAHSDYRYNQWSNPNHKSVPNVHNAHSQNTVAPQTKLHGGLSDQAQDYGLTPNLGSESSKLRNVPSQRLPQHPVSATPAIRGASAIRANVVPNHPKTVINDPLSDLQSLVTNQESKSPPKSDNYQQESVDLSAHSETSKQKPNSSREEDKASSNNVEERKDFSSPVSVIQMQNKQSKCDANELEKPVELTSKCNENSGESDISSSISVNNIESRRSSIVNSVPENNRTEVEKEIKYSEESTKTSVIVEKDAEGAVEASRTEEVILKNVNGARNEIEKTSNTDVSSVENSNYAEDFRDQHEQETDSSKGSKTEERKDRQNADKTSPNENTVSKKRKGPQEEEADQGCKRTFSDVESQLEKMFEGIGDENSDLPTVSSTSAEVKLTPGGGGSSNKKTPKKRKSQKSRAVRLSSGQSSSSESHLPSKKSKSSLVKEGSKKKIKKSLCEVVERRGPILHIEGSKDSPSTVTVINFPKGDDEDEKDKGLNKKQASGGVRAKHHNELDYRGRSRNGLFSSTLSARYDAHTTDHTWICVFCKKGPHYNTLGDLFGPYIISKDENTSLCDFSGDEKDISDAQKRGGRNKKSLRSNNMVEHFQKMSRKLRRTQSNDSCLTGMTVISDDQVDILRYEVWVHEQCAVWSPNVCLIGSRIVGMQEAIWSSVKTMCSKCGVFGANIGCVYRNCPNRSHYYCAKDAGWSLEQETFISTCHIHKPLS